MNFLFPLVMVPKRIVFVDDRGSFLNKLQTIMPRRQSREFISSPQAALHELLQEVSYWRGIEALLSGSLQARMDERGEAGLYVHSYFQDWRRFHLTSVLIVDYAMPGLNGLDLLRKLEAFPARRLLLTGQPDTEKMAIQAFNKGLIQKFIPKDTQQLAKELTASAEEMHVAVCERIGDLVHGTLSTEQKELLYVPEVVAALKAKVRRLGWIEYVLVGQPFGLLGMSLSGPLQWLQLETRGSLDELAEVVAESDFGAAEVKSICECAALSPMEIRAQLQVPDNHELIPTETLCASPFVYCAVIDLPVKVLTASEYGLDDINSIEDLMRGLLRDSTLAHQAASVSADKGRTEVLAQALSHLAATAKLSESHEQALRAAIVSNATPGELAAKIESTLGAARQEGCNDGNRRH